MIEILNETATSALSDVDVILVLVDATAAVGPGDRTVLERALREVQRSDDPPALIVSAHPTASDPYKEAFATLR
jgi:GTPase Era involved in 16S rRNA processing